MHPLTLECYIKPEGAERSEPAGRVRFAISPADHRRMEEAEEKLQHSDDRETMLNVDLTKLDLDLPPHVEALEKCQLRVYLHEEDERGHFHLVGHRKGDHSLFYTNAVMVDFVAS